MYKRQKPKAAKVNQDAFTIVSKTNLSEVNELLRGGTYAEVEKNLNQIRNDQPELAADLQIVDRFELV